MIKPLCMFVTTVKKPLCMFLTSIGVTFSETIDFNKFSKNDVIANILLLYDQDCDNSVMHTTNNLIDYHLNYCIMRKIKKTRLQPESMTSTLVLYRRLQTLMNSFAIVVAINAIKDNSCL